MLILTRRKRLLARTGERRCEYLGDITLGPVTYHGRLYVEVETDRKHKMGSLSPDTVRTKRTQEGLGDRQVCHNKSHKTRTSITKRHVEKGQGRSEKHMCNPPLRTMQKPVSVHILPHVYDVAAGLNTRECVFLEVFS